MMIARPKEYFMIQILDRKFVIEFKQQHKWKVVEMRDDIVRIERDNVSVILDRDEFERYFKVVQGEVQDDRIKRMQ